jgi:hypothetical protein
MPENGPAEWERNPWVGLPPLNHASAEAVSCPRPNALSMNAHRKVQPRQSRVAAQM